MVRLALALAIAVALLMPGCATGDQDPAGSLETPIVHDSPGKEDRNAERPGEVLQMPDHPAGCEICALQSALGYIGIDLTFDDTYALFERSESDFVNAWWGDPMTEGAAYPPAVIEAASRALDGTGRHASDASLCTVDELAEMVDDGAVSICWVTTDYAAPIWTGWYCDGSQMYSNEHAILVYDMSGGVYAMDPLRGYVAMGRDAFADIWQACGSMAVVIR